MNNQIQFTVPGDPQAQKRHRTRTFNTKGGNTFTSEYDPSRDAKKDFLIIVNDFRPAELIISPVSLQLCFYFSRPKHHYKGGNPVRPLKDNAPTWHISRPDVDNLAKFIMDALKGKYWKDDTFIYALQVIKRYDYLPRTEVIIEW